MLNKTLLDKTFDALITKDSDKLDELFDIPEIDIDRNYWFIRSNSGEYWGDFKNFSFVAIGHNNYTYEQIIEAEKNGKIELLRKQIETDEETKRPGLTINQIKNFYEKIQEGDVVVTPSKESQYISFGIITSEAYDIRNLDTKNLDDCEFYKRRNVKWIIDVPSEKLEPNLYKMVYSHQAIFDANEYSDFIDRTMYPLFKKGDSTHLKIEVTTKKKIQSRELSALLNIGSNDFLPYPTENNINVRLNVQSPGFVEFISDKDNILTILFLANLGINFMSKSFSKISKAIKDYQDIKAKNNAELRKQKEHEIELQIKNNAELRKQEMHNLKILEFLDKNPECIKMMNELEKTENLGLLLPSLSNISKNKKEEQN